MANDFFTIEIDGTEATDLYPDLLGLEVDLHEDLAGVFRIRLTMRPDGESWTWLDDERLRAWKAVRITGGVEDAAEELITGYVTQIKPAFGGSEESAVLEIWGMDLSVLMDRVEVLKDWPNKSDSDIANEIFGKYGLTPTVDATTQIHDEAVSTPIQRETDMQFLKRLALRNGYECYVQGNTAFFRKPLVSTDVKPVLAANFASGTTFENVSVQVDALTPVEIAAFQLHRSDKDIDAVDITSTGLETLGGSDSSALLGPGMEPAKVFIGPNGALGNDELTSLAQGLHDQADWFVAVQGSVRGETYGTALLPRDTVLVRGIGATYSGLYRVHRVVQVFSPDSYTQRVTLRRNALELRGDEVFDEGGGALAAVG